MNGTWSRVEVAGKAVDVYEPPAVGRFGLLFLHGIGLETLRDNPTYSRLFDELRLVCVSPHGQRSWWADRVCPEFDAVLTPQQHLLTNMLPYFERRWQIRPPAIGLLGISMGGQAALRLGFAYPRTFPAVAGIASALDFQEVYGQGSPLDDLYDSKEQCRQDTAILHVHPAQYPPHIFFCTDPADVLWYRGNDRLHEKLSALGIPHETDLQTRAGGHTWTYFDWAADRAVRFVHAGLLQESRKLL